MPYTVDSILNESIDVKPILLDQFLSSVKGNDNPLIGLGDTIVIIGWMYKINAIYILAHAIWESGWGESPISKKKFNLFGWGAENNNPYGKAWTFRNFDHCLLKVMSRIRVYYFDEQKRVTLRLMNDKEPKYASDPDWKNGICKIMNKIDKFLTDERG